MNTNYKINYFFLLVNIMSFGYYDKLPKQLSCDFFFFKYDKNSNLNSHTRIFWRSQGSNPHLHRGGFFGEGITIGPNTQMAIIIWLVVNILAQII